MSHVGGRVVAGAAEVRDRAEAGGGGKPNPASRFTPVLARGESFGALKRRGEEARSAICFPGWDRG